MLVAYDSASLVLQQTVLNENTFTFDTLTQNIDVNIERLPYDDVKGNGSITGFTYEEVVAGVQTPLECTVRLVDSNDNSVVYREVLSDSSDGSYTFQNIRDRSTIGQSYDIVAKPTTANYYKKIIEGINPLNDSVQFMLIGSNNTSHVYQFLPSFVTFKYASDSVITDLQVVCDKPVEIDTVNKTITISYLSNTVGQSLLNITFISNSLTFVISYQLPFNVIGTTLGLYLFNNNTDNEYGPDTLTVNGTPQYRNNTFIFNGSTKLQSNSSRFLTPSGTSLFTLSFKFCLYSYNNTVQMNQLFSTTETTMNAGSLYICIGSNNHTNVNRRGRIQIGTLTVSDTHPVILPLTEHTVTFVYDANRLMLYLNGYVIYNAATSPPLAINDGFVLGGGNVTSGFVSQASINGYISDFQYTKGLITTHTSIENRPTYADFQNFTLYGGSLVDDKKRLWQAEDGLTVTLNTEDDITLFNNKTGSLRLLVSHGEMDFGTGDFMVELSFSNGAVSSTLLDFGSYENSGGLHFEFNDTALLIKQSDVTTHTILGNFVGEPYTRYTLTFSRTGTTFSFYIDGVLTAVIPNFTLNIVDSTKITSIRGTDVLHYYRVIKGVSYNNGRL